MAERKPDHSFVLTERQFIDAVIRGAAQGKTIPALDWDRLLRAQVERTDNGAVLRVWLDAGETEPIRVMPAKELLAMLKAYQKHLPGKLPTKKQLESWKLDDLLEVSQWLRALHAHAAPIAGHELPPIPDQPLVLFDAPQLGKDGGEDP